MVGDLRKVSLLVLAGNAQEEPWAFCITNVSPQNTGAKVFLSPSAPSSPKCREEYKKKLMQGVTGQKISVV